MNDRAALYTGYGPVVCISVQDVVMQRKKPIKRASGSRGFSLFRTGRPLSSKLYQTL
jgi:hypothetical protein